MRQLRSKRKAVFWSLSLGLLLLLPVSYLAFLHLTKGRLPRANYGLVKEFSLVSHDGSLFLTDNHLRRRVAFIWNLKAVPDNLPELARVFCDLQSAAKTKFQTPNPDDPQPQEMIFLFMNATSQAIDLEHQAGASCGDYKYFEVAEGDLLRPVEASANFCSFEISSQEGIYISSVPCKEVSEDSGLYKDTTLRILAAETSRTYLYQYLHSQSLMWERTRQWIRGQEPSPLPPR